MMIDHCHCIDPKHRKRTMGFETMLWRVSHGNVFVKFADIDQTIEDPKTGDMLDKAVFIVFYQVPILNIAITTT